MPENRQSCFRCGTSNDADALVCKRCGGSLTSPPPAPGNMGGGRATEQDTEPFLPGPLQVGDIFHNRYKVVKLLGSGGMGMVYQVHDPMTRTEYALKLIRPELLNSERAVERFKKEFRNSEKLHHPHIIRVKHLDQAEIAGEKRYYMVLELVGGGDLRRCNEVAPVTLKSCKPSWTATLRSTWKPRDAESAQPTGSSSIRMERCSMPPPRWRFSMMLVAWRSNAGSQWSPPPTSTQRLPWCGQESLFPGRRPCAGSPSPASTACVMWMG